MPQPHYTELLAAAGAALDHAHAPYSAYRVGAAILTASGRIFTGANVENASYGLTICAERAAVATAVSAGQREFTAIAVVADRGHTRPYPCGACRQVLAEFAGPDLPVYAALADRLDDFEQITLGELLPKTFRLDRG